MRIDYADRHSFTVTCDSEKEIDAVIELLETVSAILRRGGRGMSLARSEERIKERVELARQENERRGQEVYKAYERLRSKFPHKEAYAHVQKTFDLDHETMRFLYQTGHELFIQERNKDIVQAAETGTPLEKLAFKHGLSKGHIDKVVRDYRKSGKVTGSIKNRYAS